MSTVTSAKTLQTWMARFSMIENAVEDFSPFLRWITENKEGQASTCSQPRRKNILTQLNTENVRWILIAFAESKFACNGIVFVYFMRFLFTSSVACKCNLFLLCSYWCVSWCRRFRHTACSRAFCFFFSLPSSRSKIYLSPFLNRHIDVHCAQFSTFQHAEIALYSMLCEPNS